MKRLLFRSLFLVVLAGLGNACASYYQSHLDFNSEFEQGDLKQALETLGRRVDESSSKTRFIYFVNRGLLLSILGQYEESNTFFEKAFLFGEDYRINYVNEATAYFTNPNMTVYKGEDHEHLMLLYFKAINFMKLNKPEDALVECRRLNIRLNQLADKYSSPDKLQRNAFIHNLMGLIYQSTGDYNNAFIAYRNSIDVYENDYATMFGLGVPLQLKKDLLCAAWRTGFMDEFESYKIRFGMADYVVPESGADLLFFWHDGLSPVKEEWGINFIISHGAGNAMVFSNEQMGLRFPFEVSDANDRNSLTQLEIFRVVFPRYAERPLYFQRASLERVSEVYPLQLAEDVNKVAFYSLKQRMLQEFANGLLRAALKKAAEQSLRKKDDRLGALLGIVNAMTEKADTRNWQTLPHSIFYSRVPLQEGANELKLRLAADRETIYNFTYQVKGRQTLFHTFSSLETTVGPYRYY